MGEDVVNNKRIARNTLLLYLRMLIVIGINLYASRVLLSALGIDDYGIYNVVGGIVAMFGFLNNAMVASSQRFISFEQGRADLARKISIYSTSVVIHWGIALLMVLFAETAGLWYLNHRINLPPDRLSAARWVYQGAILMSLLRIVNVPSQASVVAHERMHVYAFVSILDAVLQLGIALLLKRLACDRLAIYGLLLAGVAAVDYLIYKLYTLSSFRECRFSPPRDQGLFREMLAFAGWSFVGNLGIAMRGPGVNIIVNQFFGPAVNAAKGIAYQVSSVVTNFVTSFQTAVDPQITKRYAAKETESMISLVKSAAKYSFFLLAIVIVPLFVRADQVLDLWLETVPDLAVQFLRLTLVVSLIGSMAGPFTTGLQATGKIKWFQISIAVIMVLELPLAWALLKCGAAPYSVMWITMLIELVALLTRIFLLDRQLSIGMVRIVLTLLLRNALVLLVMAAVPLAISPKIPYSFGGLLLFCLLSVCWCLPVIWLAGLDRTERVQFLDMFKNFLKR